MAEHRPTAVLVVTTLPGGNSVRARVLSTADIQDGVESGVVVASLAELQDVVSAWWTQSWGPVAAVDAPD
jgi:hypothetical protein